MKLLEYEAKAMLASHNIPVPDGQRLLVGDIPSHLPAVLKSQVPTGGRGKAGGIVRVDTADDASREAARLFGLDIAGFFPTALLAEEPLDIAEELYLSLIIDRSVREVRVLAGREGGVDIESHTEGLFSKACPPSDIEVVARELSDYFGHDVSELFQSLYSAFSAEDMRLLEINPLAVTAEGRMVCADAKIELDDAAIFRHNDWQFEDKPADTNFVVLNQQGNVATVANGAGLAMATVDSVAAAGMLPANFLDVGGGASADTMTAAFRALIGYDNVQAIVVNIFAGITRCDEVARAIIAAREALPDLPPLFIRLAGTNYDEAVPLLEAAGIPLLPSLSECLERAKEVVS